MPPAIGPSSITATDLPAFASRYAVLRPALPAPTTQTCTWRSSCRGGQTGISAVACHTDAWRAMMALQQSSFPMPAIETEIVPATRDLGDGFKVRRALPSLNRRMVGPFVFLDEMGPAKLAPGTGLDVRPHPHIGLATVTYLFDGEILHQDSLGVRQPIRPGDVNWMIAGRGIVHSERTPQALRAAGPSAWGLQAWVALPEAEEERSPAFRHHPQKELPYGDEAGTQIRVIAGEFRGLRSPVETQSALFYADVALEPGAQLAIAPDYEERACYVADGSIAIDGEGFEPGRLLVFR